MLNKSKNKDKGFTLIELVMVIVLLGILAATALPKFADISSDAERASFEGIRGGFSSGVSIAHAAWLVSGEPDSTTALDLDGTNIYMSSGGWPENDASITTGAGTMSSTKCTAVIDTLLGNIDVGTISSSASQCNFYVPSGTASAATLNFTYDILSGAVSDVLVGAPPLT
ncbi:MAG: type II secretory pathway, pseudopilin PulG [Legionellales bacterium]|nr:MAG: type II secretory pathway, pseudopilin PulG [Legionellales bacterium]